MKNKKESYFSDSYNLLTMLFLTGNWWKPIPDEKKIQSPINLEVQSELKEQD